MYIYIYVNTSRYFSGPDVCLAYQEKKSGVLVAVSWFSFMHAPYTVMGLQNMLDLHNIQLSLRYKRCV